MSRLGLRLAVVQLTADRLPASWRRILVSMQTEKQGVDAPKGARFEGAGHIPGNNRPGTSRCPPLAHVGSIGRGHELR